MSLMKYNKALKSGILLKNSLISILKSQNRGLTTSLEGNKLIHDVGFAGYSSMVEGSDADAFHIRIAESVKDAGGQSFFRGGHVRESRVSLLTPNQLNKLFGGHTMHPCFTRSLASTSAPQPSGQTQQQNRKDISINEDPFDAPTYNIPEKPVTFTEGASYSIVILAGLAVAAAALYGVFGGLIFQPSERKVFGKALARVQNDSLVKMRIGSPIKGYGQESMNRHARQQIPSRKWTDEDGVQRVEVSFVVRGPHGYGNAHSQMFKDKADNQWKFTVLMVNIISPTPVRLLLESYIPA